MRAMDLSSPELDATRRRLHARFGPAIAPWCRRAMLKLPPDASLAEEEAAALIAWATTRRVPALWGHEAGALLLEALSSDLPLSEAGGDPPALDEVAALLRALHEVEPGPSVPALRERVEFAFALWIARHASDERLWAWCRAFGGHARRRPRGPRRAGG